MGICKIAKRRNSMFNFGKAIKTRYIKGLGKVNYFRIPKKIGYTKKILEFYYEQVKVYEDALKEHPERTHFKDHLIYLYGDCVEIKKRVYPKYQLTDKEKEQSFDYIKKMVNRPSEYIALKELKEDNEEDQKEKERIYAQNKEIIKDHFKYVWGITDDFIIDKLTRNLKDKGGYRQ
jgi:hypothetical protein